MKRCRLDDITLAKQETELEADMIANGIVVYTPDLSTVPVDNVKAVYAAEGVKMPIGRTACIDSIVAKGQ